MEKSDQDLISEYLAGDEKFLEELIKKYLKPIYGFVYRYAGNQQDAEDLAQEVFVRAWRNLRKFDMDKSFKTWIFSIAKNASIDFLKKKKAVPFSRFSARGGSAFGGENALAEIIRDNHPLPQEIIERKDLAQLFNGAIEKLFPKYREVVLLRHNENYTFREISESLGEPLNTVKSRYRRGLIMLKKLLP